MLRNHIALERGQKHHKAAVELCDHTPAMSRRLPGRHNEERVGEKRELERHRGGAIKSLIALVDSCRLE